MQPAQGLSLVGREELLSRDTDTGIHREPSTHAQTSTGHQRTQAQALSGTPPLAPPSPDVNHSPKPGLTLQSVWLDPSLPSSHPPSNESRQKTDLRAPEAKTSTCQFLLLSVDPAFCWTFIHSVSVFHLFVCSCIHFQPRRMLNKSLLSG